MPIVNMLLISLNNDDEHYKVLVKRQAKMIGIMIPQEIILLFSGKLVIDGPMAQYRDRRPYSQQLVLHNTHNKDRMTDH